jgi:transcriptional regulator with XRE-family HTH domain
MGSSRKDVGRLIKSKRNAKGLTLQALSERLGYRSIGTINNIELGLTPIPIEKLHPITRALDIDLSWFLDFLREAEPDLHQKYMVLKQQFEDEFMGNLRRAVAGRSSEISAEEARHHLGFPSPFDPEEMQARKLTIIYIIRTWLNLVGAVLGQPQQLVLDLKESDPRIDNLFLPFPEITGIPATVH